MSVVNTKLEMYSFATKMQGRTIKNTKYKLTSKSGIKIEATQANSKSGHHVCYPLNQCILLFKLHFCWIINLLYFNVNIKST